MTRQPSSFLATCARGCVDARSGNRYVVAARDIVKGERIAVFGGSVFTRAELERLGEGTGHYTLQIDDDLYMVSTDDGPGDWINHGCAPNTGMQGPITLVALRDISAGEELCFDYAMTDGSKYDEFDCSCGSPLCRRRVRGDDWRLPELWERYEGHFSPYLQAKIDRVRLAAFAQREDAEARMAPPHRAADRNWRPRSRGGRRALTRSS